LCGVVVGVAQVPHTHSVLLLRATALWQQQQPPAVAAAVPMCTCIKQTLGNDETTHPL
jgi:hypothetical protein